MVKISHLDYVTLSEESVKSEIGERERE